MATTLPILKIRARLGRAYWKPPEPFGPDGWSMIRADGTGSVIITAARQDDGEEWWHVSIAGDVMPTYAELVELHAAVWPDGHAYQCFVPPSEHVNIHERALHLWGRADGARVLPNFAWLGSI